MNPQSSTAVIECQSVYKIFGENAKKLLEQSNGSSIEDVLKKTDCVIGVDNVSFQVFNGEILVVMGLSGSGKSTLIRCITRLIDPTAGKVFIDGENILDMDDKKLIEIRRHKMGMVFQNFALLPHKTVLENIAFPLQVRGIPNADSFKRAQEMIELVSLQGRENSFPRELSGGQQQRVGIARSLAAEPDIWFLDEPFSALDPLIRQEMQDEFLRLQKMLKKTIVFITHDFQEALRLADRIAIMYHGRIEQIDTPANIVLNPATEYVRKFTQSVPREQVLKTSDVMEKLDSTADFSDASVQANVIIESVAHQILSSTKAVKVIDQGEVVGMLNPRNILQVLFDKSNH